MKKLWMLFLMVFLGLSLSGVTAAWGVGTAFTYQGLLNDGGSPAEGTYDLRFSLFSVVSGGSALGTDTKNDVGVSGGYFTVELDFGSVFDGNERWLEIEVRPGASTGGYTLLTPRQPIRPTPYALYAANGAGGSGFWAANGNDIYSTNSGDVGIGTTTPATKLDLNGELTHRGGALKHLGHDFIMASAARGDGGRALVHWGDGSGTDDQLILNFAGDYEEGVKINGSKLIVDGNLGIGTSQSLSKLSFGTTWNPKMLALWDGVNDFYGFGTDIGRMTFYAMDAEVMTLNSLGWLGLGTPFPAGYLDITGTADAMTLARINQTGNKEYNGLRLDRDGVEKWFVGMNNTDDNLTFRRNAVSNDMVIKNANGYVGIGTMNPQQLLHVYGFSNPRILVESPSGTPEINIKRGASAWGLFMGSSNGLHFFNSGTKATLTGAGDFGIGTSSPSQKLDVDYGDILVQGPGSCDAPGEQGTVYLGTTHHFIRGEYGFGVKIGTYGPGESIFLKELTGNVGIGTSNPGAKLDVRGRIRVSNSAGNPVVELGEGLDYAEGFDVSDDHDIGPGTLLIIDPDHPGQLKISAAAYDRKIAGIVAGANGLGSGVRLGTGDFDHDVALSGRVYCNVDAAFGAVSPGDLLTTSATPGYAMVVKDFSRAQGAILGKAMEPLVTGEKGQILVLVTLQ